MGRYHLNTETTLGLVYIAVSILCIVFLSLPIPRQFKARMNAALSQITYYLALFALLPVWITFNAVLTLNRLTTKGPLSHGPNPHLNIDKYKGKVLKQQRNLLIGGMGIVLFLIFYRFHRIFSQNDAILDAQASAIRNTNEKVKGANAPAAGDISMRETLEKRKPQKAE